MFDRWYIFQSSCDHLHYLVIFSNSPTSNYLQQWPNNTILPIFAPLCSLNQQLPRALKLPGTPLRSQSQSQKNSSFFKDKARIVLSRFTRISERCVLVTPHHSSSLSCDPESLLKATGRCNTWLYWFNFVCKYSCF